MTGERQSWGGVKIRTRQVQTDRSRQYERGLQEVELPGELLQGRVGDPGRIGNTASRLPPNGRSVNTSTREKPNPMAQPTTTSISTAAPSGRAATPIAVRAG